MRPSASPRRCSGICTPGAGSSSTFQRTPSWQSRADWRAGQIHHREVTPENTRDDYDQQGLAAFFACADDSSTSI